MVDMVVEVRLFATFREGRFKEKELELPEESSVGDLLKYLKIPEKDAKVIIVNGLGVSVEHKLRDHDVVAIFPPVAGG
jgi:molybdopterin converting factor small subunit